ncbi:hypothetical protein ACOHX9_000052 [Yersinia enterocolitica]|uniref:hypothetical protein n=1 Tax=Yersinia enterocolitica TaxID=630 RepID=UPI0005E372A9|nr:hypothetical protein [Yersinia enterocolitica]EKN3489240.1 hypothetical protein [Yersinia enterocolitica]EKN5073835.1 hypothetical protein [Yersinia enterocolitica]EKN6165472.1 hypothetical protein [Yersinia enterocolitica]ELI8169223.1 hypothetical protein [Yersinia enterocolitica]ELW7386957.1 hypothetical protein [Yersinia enterocolitica]
MFGIFQKGQPICENDEMVLPASIIIDEFTEPLYIPLSYWSFENYQKSWLSSIEEGLQNKKHSALAVSMYEPDYTNFIFIWVLYYSGNEVFVQNNILFLDECSGFTPESINDFIEPRTTYNEDEMKISEWSTDLKSVIDFYNSLK